MKKSAQRIFAMMLAAVLSAGFLPQTVSAVSSDEIRQQINATKERNKGIQEELNAIQSQYNANANEISDLVSRKDAMDQEINLMAEQIQNYNTEIASYGQLIADTQLEVEAAQQRFDELSKKHKERIRAMEEGGELSYWDVIFESSTIIELLDRVNMVQEINEADQRRLKDMKIAADDVELTRQQMAQEKQELENSKNMLEATQATLELKREEADGVLRELLAKEEEIAVLLDEASDKMDALMAEIAQMEKQYQAAKHDEYLAKLAAAGTAPPSNATWVRPLDSLRITSPFGVRVHPITHVKRSHNGVDFGAPAGTPIYATRAGTVTKAAYQPGGAGYYVSINHGDGFSSIYMHMTNYIVSTGQTIKQGQVIGYVGSTGLSTGAHLHFGVSYAGKYVNPLAYIV